MFRNILIIGHSCIGDVCYDLVTINPLRMQFKDARITFLTSPISRNIAEGHKGINKVIAFDKHGADNGFRGRLRVMHALRKEHFDLVVVLRNTSMHKFLSIPHQWSVREYLDHMHARGEMHIADVYLEFLRSRGVKTQEAIWDFNLETEKEFCETSLSNAGIHAQDKIIGILPYSGWSLKDWPVEKWVRLARSLKQHHGFKFIAFGKTAEPEKEVLKQSPETIFSMIGKTTLKQALALIGRCDLFIGADSSLLHLASCIGVETIGLYGATSKDNIYPYFHRHNIIGPSQEPGCMPCYPGLRFCPCMKKKVNQSPCMQNISVDDVLEAVLRKIDCGRK